MSRSWHSLYAPVSDVDRVAEALRQALVAHGYTLYDPFPGGSGFAAPGWKRLVRQFAAPPSAGWVRVVGEPDPDTLPQAAASLGVPLIYASLSEAGAALSVWSAEGSSGVPEAFAPWLRADRTPDDLRRALAGDVLADSGGPEGPTVGGVPLPEDVRDLARRVDPGQAEKLMDSLTRSLFGKLGGGKAEAQARDLIGAGGSPWQTPAGAALRAALDCLVIPQGWSAPSFEEVSDAYQVARARQRNPRGLRLPGDDEALTLAPDALDYRLVFAGKP